MLQLAVIIMSSGMKSITCSGGSHLEKWPRNFHYILLRTIRMTVFREEDRFIRKAMYTFGKVLENTKTAPKGYPLPNFNPITALI